MEYSSFRLTMLIKWLFPDLLSMLKTKISQLKINCARNAAKKTVK